AGKDGPPGAASRPPARAASSTTARRTPRRRTRPQENWPTSRGRRQPSGSRSIPFRDPRECRVGRVEPGGGKDRSSVNALLADGRTALWHHERKPANAGRSVAGNDRRVAPFHGAWPELMAKLASIHQQRARPETFGLERQETQRGHERLVGHRHVPPLQLENAHLWIVQDEAPFITRHLIGHRSPPGAATGQPPAAVSPDLVYFVNQAHRGNQVRMENHGSTGGTRRGRDGSDRKPLATGDHVCADHEGHPAVFRTSPVDPGRQPAHADQTAARSRTPWSGQAAVLRERSTAR